MARPRIPRAKAAVSGATLKDPQRYRDRGGVAKPRPVGKPYANMTPAQCAAWNELAGEMPWLNSAHRTLLRMTCYLVARLNNDPEFGVSASQTLSSLLSKLGATPVDESRVNYLDPEDEDPDERYFSSRH